MPVLKLGYRTGTVATAISIREFITNCYTRSPGVSQNAHSAERTSGIVSSRDIYKDAVESYMWILVYTHVYTALLFSVIVCLIL